MAPRGEIPKGFTLVEAAVALAVVVILAGLAIPLVIKNLEDSRVTRARNDLQVIAGAVATLLKDTGTRPMNDCPGEFGTGEGDAYFFSNLEGLSCADLNVSTRYGASESARWMVFRMLLGGRNVVTGAMWPNPSEMFYGVGTSLNARTEVGWKGPYLGLDMCAKRDPWGGRYYILGLNENGQRTGSPIWVVSAGPDHRIQLSVNPAPASATLPKTWTYTGYSQDDLALRVH